LDQCARRARDGLVAVGVAALLLLLVEGPSIRNSGERMDDGLWKTVVLAIGRPADRLGDVTPLPELGDEQIVRESDGVHLNAEGARVAADRVLEEIRADFGG
jgi:lysophospholipase L1-like esterase